MSYEGYEEKLCAKGHYFTYDAYFDVASACPRCGGRFAFRHAVDQTNGIEHERYDEDGQPLGAPLPQTIDAEKEEIGFEDDWREDHHGNKYAVRVPLYKPVCHWSKL